MCFPSPIDALLLGYWPAAVTVVARLPVDSQWSAFPLDGVGQRDWCFLTPVTPRLQICIRMFTNLIFWRDGLQDSPEAVVDVLEPWKKDLVFWGWWPWWGGTLDWVGGLQARQPTVMDHCPNIVKRAFFFLFIFIIVVDRFSYRFKAPCYFWIFVRLYFCLSRFPKSFIGVLVYWLLKLLRLVFSFTHYGAPIPFSLITCRDIGSLIQCLFIRHDDHHDLYCLVRPEHE